MKVKENAAAYLAVMENNPNGSELMEVDSMLSECDSVLDHPDVPQAFKKRVSKTRDMIVKSKADLKSGKKNTFWENRKAKVNKAVDIEAELQDYPGSNLRENGE